MTVNGRPEISSTTTPPIETDRLTLEPLRPDALDAPEMLGVLADPASYVFIGGAPPTLEELQARFARWALGSPRPGERWHNWVVRLRERGEAIGHVQATVIKDADDDADARDDADDGRSADIAWLIGTAWQGRGYASEAVRALVGWLEVSGVRTITAHVHPRHAASGRVAAAAGLAPTAEIEDGEVVWRVVT